VQSLRAFLIVASLAFVAEALAETDPLPPWERRRCQERDRRVREDDD